MPASTTMPVELFGEDKYNLKAAAVRYPPSPPRSNTPSVHEDHDGVRDHQEPSLPDIPLPPVSNPPTKILEIDANTPDKHVARDPRVVRLTGVHPFNVESPLSLLYDSGFLTPPELFYVRNHGAVPEVHDADVPDWEVTIEGLVDNPLTLTLGQIMRDFEQVTVAITLVCAGNRRKEQNQVRKSNGFSWGAGGVSTALWTGPMLADVLRAARPQPAARFLCMQGADDALPHGPYATSVRLGWVADRARGIMLAHAQNGAPLAPDHGRPLRVVVPGVIGGRSVKWLRRLVVTDAPSDNWYHRFDNRVLPTMVTPEMAAKDPSWWKDERYAIYDLSVNSAIAYPAHDEELVLASAGESYTIRGYAYTGGMRRVTRVELSFDKGRTWQLADIAYPEDKYRETEQELFGGRLDMATRDACYCWCFWSLETRVATLAAADDVVVRAMDDAMSIQPRDMYWSVLGMMHNAWFRVAIRRDAEGVLRFEHPTQPTPGPSGWMDRVKREGGDFSNGNWGEKIAGVTEEVAAKAPVEQVRMVNEEVNRTIEITELRAHDNADCPWFVVNGEVYDGTRFLEGHPGGASSIISAAGLDATDEFMAIHSETAKAMMPSYHVGTLSAAGRKALANREADAAGTQDDDDAAATFLNPRAWKRSALVAKKIVSRDTRVFTFGLDSETQALGLPVGQHLLVKVKDSNDEVVARAYTPISKSVPNGVVELLVKIYFGTATAPGGKMTQALDKLDVGHTVELKGPLGKLAYLGRGRVSLSGETRSVRSFLMICGGSGITPIFQVLRAVMDDPADATRCVVLDGNRFEDDILCRDELDAFAARNPERLKLVHTLTKPADTWTGRRGRVDRDLIASEITPGGQSLVLVCGPEPMEKAVRSALEERGVEDRDIVFF